MRRILGTALVILLVAVGPFASQLSAQARQEPWTMGTLLLRGLDQTPGFLAAATEALASPDPGVRAVAARIVTAHKATAAGPALRAALVKETESGVAVEQIRALVVLGSADDLAAAKSASRRDLTLGEAYAWSLARYRPGELIAELPALTEALPLPRLTGAVMLSAQEHPAERDALLTAWADRSSVSWNSRPASMRDAANLPVPARPTMRSARSLWPGMLASVVRAADCRLSNSWPVGGILATFGAGGLPKAFSHDVSSLSAACGRALDALVSTILPEPERPSLDGDTLWVVMPFAQEFVACADAPLRGAPARATPVAGPKKLKGAPAVYPRSAFAEGREGIVIMDAVVSATGCVRDAQVLRGVHTIMDLEAIRAILQWHYQPAIVAGQPTDMLVTITTNFSMK